MQLPGLTPAMSSVTAYHQETPDGNGRAHMQVPMRSNDGDHLGQTAKCKLLMIASEVTLQTGVA